MRLGAWGKQNCVSFAVEKETGVWCVGDWVHELVERQSIDWSDRNSNMNPGRIFFAWKKWPRILDSFLRQWVKLEHSTTDLEQENLKNLSRNNEPIIAGNYCKYGVWKGGGRNRRTEEIVVVMFY